MFNSYSIVIFINSNDNMNIDKIVLPSNFKFGTFLFIISFLAFIFFYYNKNRFWFYLFGVLGLVIFFVTILKSDILSPLNKLWFKFGLLLGTIVNPIVMGLIFFGFFTPIAIFMRLIARDELRLKFKNQSTYWIKRKISNQIESFKEQF